MLELAHSSRLNSQSHRKSSSEAYYLARGSGAGQYGSMAFEINPLNQPLADGSGLTGLMKQKTQQRAISLKVVVRVRRSAIMFKLFQACCHAAEKVI